MDEKIAAPKETALIELRHEFKGNTAATQRERLRQALHRHVAVTTIEARRFLDILHPAGRAMELRRMGVNITTLWQTVVTEAGVKHRVGLYVLQRGPTEVCAVNAPDEWLESLYSLATRLSHTGVSIDLACLSLAELWGVYRFLRRIAEGG